MLRANCSAWSTTAMTSALIASNCSCVACPSASSRASRHASGQAAAVAARSSLVRYLRVGWAEWCPPQRTVSHSSSTGRHCRACSTAHCPASSMAGRSLPSTRRACQPCTSASAAAPRPRWRVSTRTEMANWLFSHTNSRGNSHRLPRLRLSWKAPSSTAPSPKKATVTLPWPSRRPARATPVEMGRPAATIPLAPSTPCSKAATCMEPPLPRQ